MSMSLQLPNKIMHHTSTNMLSRDFLFSVQSVASCSAGGNRQQPVYTVISGQWPKSILKSWKGDVDIS